MFINRKVKHRRRIAEMIEVEFAARRRIPGSRKITEILRNKGESINRGLVARIMREKC